MSETTRSQWSLNVARQHPAGHGPIAMALETSIDGDREVIVSAEPVIYPMHRGAEKLFESRDYQQLLSLVDRHDWLSSFGSELGLAMTVEQMSGITVPERATWIRTMMAELNRAIHHLRWLGESMIEVLPGRSAELSGDAHQLMLDVRSAREQLTALHEAASGGRLHPMLVAYGGVKQDLPDRWANLVDQCLMDIEPTVGATATWWRDQEQLRGIGMVPTATAVEFAVSGAVARASGSPLDLRFNEPYLNYSELVEAGVLHFCAANEGDAWARFTVLANELAESLNCVRYASHRLATPELVGPINVRLPRTIRVPESSGYGWTENPSGVNGWYLISTGGPTPERLKLRTASFANAQALCQVLVGSPIDDLKVTMLSFLLVSGDLAK